MINSMSKSKFFIAWLVLWVFIANIPTEASWKAFPNLLRFFAWAMVWMPILIFFGISLNKKLLFSAILIFSYVLILNITFLRFDAFLMVANIANAFFIASIYGDTKYTPQFLKALDFVLFVWAGLFLLQLSVFILSGSILELHSNFFPFSEARYYQAAEGLFRLTGPHIEPGTYCAWSYGIVILRVLLGKKIFVSSVVLAIGTFLFTFSAWGYIALSAFLVVGVLMFIANREKTWFVGALFVLSIVFLFFFKDRIVDIQEYLGGRASLDDVSGQSKKQAYDEFYRNIENYLLWGKNFSYDFCGGCLSPQDSGVMLNLIVYLGLPVAFLLMAFILMLFYNIGGFSYLILSIPLLFIKYYIWETIIWILFFVAVIGIRRKN